MASDVIAVRSLKEWAREYLSAGWHPIELPAGAKWPPAKGVTGDDGRNMTAEEIDAAEWSGNIGVRMPADVIGLDIDVYKGGGTTLDELLARCGDLPNTWISHSGRNDGSGIRYFRVPVGMSWVTGLPGIEIIQRRHRYSAVRPSKHPDGREYGWWDQAEDEPSEEIPRVEDLPELPWPWIRELSRAASDDDATSTRAANLDEVQTFLDECIGSEAPGYLTVVVARFRDRWGQGFSRHDTMQHCLIWAMECARAGIVPARDALFALGAVWVEALADDPRRALLTSSRRTTEFAAMVRHAIGKVRAAPQSKIDKLHDDVAGIPMHVPPPPSARDVSLSAPGDSASIFLDWSTFARRDDSERRWLVQHFWPWGRALALYADAKTGKSELALWCAASLALGQHPWNRRPVEPIDVAYFDFEMTEDDLEERLTAFGFAPSTLVRLHYALLPPLHPLDVENGGRQVEQLVAEVGAQAVIFDTFGRAVAGEENEADTVRDFYRYTGSRLKRLGVGYLRTDHAGKDRSKGQRGSSAKREDVDIVWSMTRSGDGVVLDCSKSSRISYVRPILKLTRSEDSGTLVYSAPIRMSWPEGTAAKASQMDALGLPLNISFRKARDAMSGAGITPGANDIVLAALEFRQEMCGTPVFGFSAGTRQRNDVTE